MSSNAVALRQSCEHIDTAHEHQQPSQADDRILGDYPQIQKSFLQLHSKPLLNTTSQKFVSPDITQRAEFTLIFVLLHYHNQVMQIIAQHY